MAHAIESRASSPANELRDRLDQAERQVVTLTGANIEAFLLLLDQIEQMFTDLAQNATDLRPEAGRWESLLSRLNSQPNPLVSAANKAGGLAQLRAKHPPATSFWWHLDTEMARRRAALIKRTAITGFTVCAALAILLWGINFFFPPDPVAVLITSATGNAQQLILEQKWEEALREIQTARQTLPNEPELAIWEGVLLEQLGQTDQAQTVLAQAQQQLPDQLLAYWLTLGNTRLQVGNIAGANTAASEALTLAPDDAQANFLVGNIAEAQGDTIKAIEVFSRTFALAEQSNPQLAVIARVRMGNLLQRADIFATTPPTTTLTPQP